MKKQKPRYISGAQMHFSHPLPSGLYRRLRNRTGSTALAARGLGLFAVTAGGEFHPAPEIAVYIVALQGYFVNSYAELSIAAPKVYT